MCCTHSLRGHVEEGGEGDAFAVTLAVVQQLLELRLALQLAELSLQKKLKTSHTKKALGQ